MSQDLSPNNDDCIESATSIYYCMYMKRRLCNWAQIDILFVWKSFEFILNKSEMKIHKGESHYANADLVCETSVKYQNDRMVE